MIYTIPESEYPIYYHNYVLKANKSSIKEGFDQSLNQFAIIENHLKGVDGDYKYQEGKWSIKELLLHIIDTERIFSYRALCIARGETNSLPGFDQDEYVANCNASNRTLTSVIEEYRAVRKATAQLFVNFNTSELMSQGIANGNTISVRAIALIILGHETHHIEILENRYL